MIKKEDVKTAIDLIERDVNALKESFCSQFDYSSRMIVIFMEYNKLILQRIYNNMED